MTHKPTPLPTKTATTEDLRYLAGYFDGEGSVCWNCAKRKAPVVYVAIQSADLEILEEFVACFGGVLRPIKRNTPRQMYSWQRTGVSAQETLRQLIPYLRMKRRIAELALEADFSTKAPTKVSPEEIQKRRGIVEITQAFNRRVTRHAS